MRHTTTTHTNSPIGVYLAFSSILLVIGAVAKLLMVELPLETRKVMINGFEYAYQGRSGQEKDTLTHMVKTYGHMVIANNMNRQCSYLTPVDSTTLNDNTRRFGILIKEVVKYNGALSHYVKDLRHYDPYSLYECGAIGRSAVEHYTHASRAISVGFSLYSIDYKNKYGAP